MSISSDDAIGLHNTLQLLVTTDGKPALIFTSDVTLDVEIVKSMLARFRKPAKGTDVDAPIEYVPGTFEVVDQNLSPIDQSIVQVSAPFFHSFFASLSFASREAILEKGFFPSHAEFFLILFR